MTMPTPAANQPAEAEADPRRAAAATDAVDRDGADDATPCGDLPLSMRVEALLISSDRPLTEARLAAVLGLPSSGAARAVREAVETLNRQYDEQGRSFRAERVAGGWQLLTRAELGELLTRLHAERQQARLSQAALETLAIIAYRQPVMRAEVEAIRGVACGDVLRGLLERRLVKIVGRAEELGRPMLYGTTRTFLDVFGLAGLDDLPALEGVEPRERAVETARDGGGDGDGDGDAEEA